MTNSRRITLYQPHLTHVLEAVAFEPHLGCIYYRCLQCDGAHSHKPAGFWFPRDCQWDSRSYKVNRCYRSPLRVALSFSAVFSPLHTIMLYDPHYGFLSLDTSVMSHLLSICEPGADSIHFVFTLVFM